MNNPHEQSENEPSPFSARTIFWEKVMQETKKRYLSPNTR